MAIAVGSIFARLGVDAAPFSLGLNAAAIKSAQFESSVAAHLARVDRSFRGTFGRVGGIAKGAFSELGRLATSPIIPLLTVGGAVAGVTKALGDLDAIGKQSKAAGVTAEQFQALSYAAELGGSNVDQLATSLNFFAKNVGLAASKQGDLYAKLLKTNPALLKQIEAATTQADRINLAADAIAKAGSASEAASLATTLFGDSGTKLVEVFRGGSTALAETAAKAKSLGIIIDNDVVAHAEEMNDQFTTASKVIGVQFQRALIQLAPTIVGTIKLVGDLAADIGGLVEAISKLPAMLDGPGAGLGGNQPYSELLNPQEKDALTAAIYKAGTRANAGLVSTPGLYDGFATDKSGKLLVQQAAAIADTATGLGKVADASKAVDLGIQSATASIDKMADSLKSAIDLGTSFANTFIDDLFAGKSATESLSDAFGDLGKQLIKMAADQAIQALLSSLIGAAFGGPTALSTGIGFGIPIATGGLVRGPGSGTSDSIPARLSNGEYVINARATARHRPLLEAINSRGYANGGFVGPDLYTAPMPAAANGSRIGPTITISSPVDARGSNLSKAEFRAILDQRDKALLKAMPAALADQRRRGRA